MGKALVVRGQESRIHHQMIGSVQTENARKAVKRMINKEVIIFQIEDMLSNINKDNLLLNGGRIDDGATFLELMTNVLALLKEQETEDTGRCRVFQCKKCGFGIDDIFVNDEQKYQIVPSYCPNCGRKVKWND